MMNIDQTYEATCIHCGVDLKSPHSVEIKFYAAGEEIYRRTHIESEDRTLRDIDRLIENGYGSVASCVECGEFLSEAVKEEEEVAKGIPMVMFSNDELSKLPIVKAGDKIACSNCGGSHVLVGGRDEKGNPSELLLSYVCGDKVFLGAVANRLLGRAALLEEG